MRHSMPDREALVILRPKSGNDWKQIRAICGYIAVGLLVVASIFFLKHRHQEEMERAWSSATAAIEDVRPVLASNVETARGSAMLYQLEILANYSAAGVERKRWIRVENQPELLADAQLKAFRWKGKRCLVRWKTSEPDHVIAELI